MNLDRIVIDTASTGHTVRLLQLPTFVNALAGNLIRFRSKMSDAVSMFQNMFSSDPNPASSSVNTALDKLESIPRNMARVQRVRKDPTHTVLTGGSILTTCAVAGRTRLGSRLQAEDTAITLPRD